MCPSYSGYMLSVVFLAYDTCIHPSYSGIGAIVTKCFTTSFEQDTDTFFSMFSTLFWIVALYFELLGVSCRAVATFVIKSAAYAALAPFLLAAWSGLLVGQATCAILWHILGVWIKSARLVLYLLTLAITEVGAPTAEMTFFAPTTSCKVPDTTSKQCGDSATPGSLSACSSTISLGCDDILSTEDSSPVVSTSNASPCDTPRTSDDSGTVTKEDLFTNPNPGPAPRPCVTLEVGTGRMVDANCRTWSFVPRPAGAVWGDIVVYELVFSPGSGKVEAVMLEHHHCQALDYNEYGRLVPLSGKDEPDLTSSVEMAAALGLVLRHA